MRLRSDFPEISRVLSKKVMCNMSTVEIGRCVTFVSVSNSILDRDDVSRIPASWINRQRLLTISTRSSAVYPAFLRKERRVHHISRVLAFGVIGPDVERVIIGRGWRTL